MTERALDAHGPQVAAFVEDAGHSHYGVELQERHRRGRVVEIDLAGLQLLDQGGWQGVDVHLQADGERGLRADAGADAAVPLAGDRLVQMERVSPERLAAEGLEAEGASPLVEHLGGVVSDDLIEGPLAREDRGDSRGHPGSGAEQRGGAGRDDPDSGAARKADRRDGRHSWPSRWGRGAVSIMRPRAAGGNRTAETGLTQ